ncbi:MipA/OmpV family protein [Pseudoduganella violacea]|uniref:Outer membrane scaffolding protein for murein synthesis (MipA/OmpV family) n=1 Tax=Pseudoduganella violacea TaxID=1715466 RepID=A0A7W5B940_9BURK|nr:MipA/OmpV family protein [Pseudoduganella violacea]MBB3118794.1 outer membrane scaffolding protein for murein synthesis (MipA/OmpV family) [Pseudoduganella violacea]
MVKYLIAVGALAAALPAWAQSDFRLLPEGSKDIAVGALLGYAPDKPGSARRSMYLVPQFSVDWDNGVFLNGLSLGMRMSKQPLLQYGPVIALDLGARRADGGSSRLRPVFGGFVDYHPLSELSLHAHAYAPASSEGSGVLLNLQTGTQFALVPHHFLALSAGVNLVDRTYMQSDFGTARYHPGGGLHDSYANVRWSWELNRKFTLVTSVQVSRLQGDAAASPRTAQRTGVTNSLMLRYSY